MIVEAIFKIFIIGVLILDALEHRYLKEEFNKLKEWVEVLHGINFDKMTKAVREWQAEQTEPTEREGE